MSIVDRFKDHISSLSIQTDFEVLDRYICHKTPFKVRIKINTNNKRIKINGFRLELIWKERRSSKIRRYGPPTRIHHASRNYFKTHIIQVKKTDRPFIIEPNESFVKDLTFSTEGARNYEMMDRFYLKLNVDVPNMIDTMLKKRIEVLPEFPIYIPFIAMVERLGFQKISSNIFDEDIVYGNSWKMSPPEGIYSNFVMVKLEVYSNKEIYLGMNIDIEMCEHPCSMSKGIHESVCERIQFERDNIIKEDIDSTLLFVSNRINQFLKGAEKDFNDLMKMNHEQSLSLKEISFTSKDNTYSDKEDHGKQ